MTWATQILQDLLPPIMEVAITLVLFVELNVDIVVRKICSIIVTHNYGML